MSERQEAKASVRGRLLSPQTIVSTAVGVALLVFLVTRFNVDMKAVWSTIKACDPLLYGAAFVSYYAGFVARGLRWRILLTNATLAGPPNAQRPTVWRCTQLVLVGWFLNAILWFRMGDGYRAYGVKESSGIGMARALGTVAAERVIDIVTVFCILLVATVGLFLLGKGVSLVIPLAFGAVLVVVLVGGVLLMRRLGPRLLRFMPTKVARGYELFYDGTIHSFRQMPLVLVLSLMAWLLEVGRLFFVVKALDLDVSVLLVAVTGLANSLIAALPVTPGGVGLVEPSIVTLLRTEVTRESAVSVTLLDRSISYVSVIVLGALAFWAGRFWNARAARKQAG